MGWETIDKVKPAYVSADLPKHGVTVGTRGAARGTRYIAIRIGADLARAARFALEQHNVRLMLGGGSDAGKIAIALDQQGGAFRARRQKSGAYLISIDRKSAEGLFTLDFPAFRHERVEAIRPENGQPSMFVFAASTEMLAVDD